MRKVMLVEDDPTMVSLLNTLLEIEGYQVVEPVDFEQVFDVIRAEHPDVVLIDVHLKDINGFDLLDGLRQDNELKMTRVIMSSGMDFSSECLQKGADDFILKPYMPDELIRKIKKQLRT